jgi:hypothetical protein
MPRGSASQKERASGATQAEEVVRELAEEIDKPAEPELPEERARQFRTPGFHRMRTDWRAEDQSVMAQIRSVIDERIVEQFMDAYETMEILYEIVREPERDAKGDVIRDRFGFAQYRRSPSGGWIEDFTKLTNKQKENFLFIITTRLFAWEQKAADAWSEAMYAKVMWEERFSISYDAPRVGTIDDRTAKGRIESAEERYFAIFMSAYSRKADAIVRTLSLLGQRLKDAMTV